MRDPARDPERRPLRTDPLRNVDIPATAYNINVEVSVTNFYTIEVRYCVILHH